MTIRSGYSVEYLLEEVATGRENYYTGAVAEGEPPGRWWGAGAEALGLTGEVAAQDMRAVYERFLDPREEGFSDPDRWDEVYTLGHTGRAYATEQQIYDRAREQEPDATPERLTELWTQAGQQARHNVAFFDATFSVQKSITLVHTAFEAREVTARNAGNDEEAAAWGQLRSAVEDAIRAGNEAGLAFLEQHACYSRVGHHGGAAGQFVDGNGFTVASFFQHDSREGDPQLHFHNTIHNRVEGPDGVWRTLDSRALHRWRPAAAAVAERTTEEAFTAALGMALATRPDGKAREVVGVNEQAMGLVSSRRRQVTARTAELVEAYTARHGRAPNSYTLACLAQEATLATRKAKSHEGVSREQLLDRVENRMRAEIDGGLGGIADAALAARPEALLAERWSPRDVIALALHEVQQSHSGWTKADLMAALNRALPDFLGLPDHEQVDKLLSSLADDAISSEAVVEVRPCTGPAEEALPDEYRRADGSSVFAPPGGTLYATAEHVHTERALANAAGVRDAAVMAQSSVGRFLAGLEREGTHLGAAQEAAVRGVLTSGARVECLVGPAGTGKSFVVGAIQRAWTDPELTGGAPRRVFGLALAQGAADVLAGNGLIARNTAAWLRIQDRLDAGHPLQGEQAFRLRPTDIVVIDESSMADTTQAEAVAARVDAAGAKLLFAGDPAQLGAVGAGGVMDLVADSGAPCYELNDARRFRNAWEADASLRLRHDPAVLDEYYRRGRLIECDTVADAEHSASEAWLADTLAGKRCLLLVDTNDTGERLSSQLRARLVELGLVDEHGVHLGRSNAYAGVGDWVEARRIGHELVGYAGNSRAPRNRELFRVTAIRSDGALEVTTDLHRPAAGADHGGGSLAAEPAAAEGEQAPQRLLLSPEYVAADLTLGYASTSYCGIGRTVDTTQQVPTPTTGRAAFLVNATRGQDSNTMHVPTLFGAQDPADGTAAEQTRRSARASLAAMFERDEPDLSALGMLDEHGRWVGSLQTIGEVFAEAAHRGATARTMGHLDRLTDHGLLTAGQRDELAAEGAAANLTRILRRAEIAGHDPYDTLHAAITSGSLAGSRNLSNVVYSRLWESCDFTPAGQRWADRVPALDDPQLTRFLHTLAEGGDRREVELGAQAAADPPRWATELLGPLPDDNTAPEERAEWERKAGAVAGAREGALGRDAADADDAASRREPVGRPVEAADVLGRVPGPGRPEAHAASRAAWEALGRPQAEREELELSNGALLARVRAWERERRAAPPWVADELAGTRQAAAEQRRTAVLRRAEADAAADDPQRAGELRTAADAADVHATDIDGRVELLEIADHAYNRWSMETAVTRLKGERGSHALNQRDADRAPEPDVTAEQWLTERDAAARAQEEAERTISENDLADQAPPDLHDQSTDDNRDRGPDDRGPVLETDVPDLREVAAAEPAPREPQHQARIPDIDETTDSNAKARRFLADLASRRAYEDSLDTAEDRDADLSREDPFADNDARSAADDDSYDAADS